jgi:hypothetical protein
MPLQFFPQCLEEKVSGNNKIASEIEIMTARVIQLSLRVLAKHLCRMELSSRENAES